MGIMYAFMGLMAVLMVILVIQNIKLSHKVDKLTSENKRLRWDINQVGNSVQTVLDGVSLNVDMTKSLGHSVDTLHSCVKTLMQALEIRYTNLRLVNKD